MNPSPAQALPPESTNSVVLASASRTRAELLRKAGIQCVIEPARIDETAVRQSLQAAGASPDDAAMSLAELKATKLSRQHGDRLVVGADQLLTCGDAWFDKPPDLAHARAQLMALRGRTHHLHNAVCVVLSGAVIWRHGEQARLRMRSFSDGFLDAYLAEAGAAVLQSVGAYQLEGLVVQLFAEVEGDHFAILGLPLLPLLDFLRGRGALPA